MISTAFVAPCALALIQVPKSATDATVVAPAFALTDSESTACDVAENGDVYALGSTWKMTFTADGATFIAILGESAPRNMGLHFAFPGRAKPHLEGNRVTIDRGAFTEVYDLAPGQVEQSFVISQRAHDGDLVMRIPLATELAADARDSNGLRFVAKGLGRIAYGDATTIDAVGRQVESESRVSGGAIEIVVPDAFLDAATYPIVIDPILQAFPIDNTVTTASDPDIVYCDSFDDWFVAYERTISASDRDILVRRFDGVGTMVTSFAIEASTADTIDPAIAERAGIVVTTWDKNGFGEGIQCRRIVASTSVMGTTFELVGSATTGGQDFRTPDIGITEENVARPFFVAWSDNQNVTSQRVRIRATSDSGNLGVLLTDAFTTKPEVMPSVQQRNALGEPVRAVCQFTDTQTGKQGLVFAEFLVDGTPQVAFLLPLPAGTESLLPVIAGGAQAGMVAWISSDASGTDVLALPLNYTVAGLTDLGSIVDLGAEDHGGVEAVDQFDVAVATDGARFVVAYSEEKVPGGNPNVSASVWGIANGQLTTILDAIPVATEGVAEFEVAVGSAGFDQPGQHLIAWTEDVTGTLVNDNINGALFSALETGGTTTVQTGCGSPETVLITSTPVIAGQSLNVSIIGSPAPIMIAGLPTATMLCASQTPGCVLGATMLVVAAVPPSFTVNLPTNAALIGATIAMQVLDVLPPNATGPLCGPPKYTQKFRVSDTRVITIQ